MNLQEAQSYIRNLIKVLHWCDSVRPTSVTLTRDKYDEISKLTNPFNMTTIAWLETTCNITIVINKSVNKVEYSIDEILAKL